MVKTICLFVYLCVVNDIYAARGQCSPHPLTQAFIAESCGDSFITFFNPLSVLLQNVKVNIYKCGYIVPASNIYDDYYFLFFYNLLLHKECHYYVNKLHMQVIFFKCI